MSVKKKLESCLVCVYPKSEHGPNGKVAAYFWSHRKFIPAKVKR